MNNNEYSLYHYGIPGMRWGKRKGKVSSDKPKSRRKSIGKKIAKGALLATGTLLVGNLIYAEASMRKDTGGEYGVLDLGKAVISAMKL